jgi:serine/threonine protein kinase
LEDVLGVGGFGIVYRAKGVYFGEEVAIKEYFPSAISDRHDGTTVAPTDSSSEEVYALGLKKFLEEAKVLWGLSKPERHPNIVNVRSLFEIHGTAYMVMDFEKGTSLSQMLKDGKTFDEASLLALLRPICEGLDRAHKAGVLHRDIKPANILVDDTGRPVLIDFGSARFESGNATNTKVTFYTPPYAAIEQYVKTYPQGAWTDIYALGVVLYQCVTGEKPAEVLERMHGDQDRPLSDKQWPGFSRTFTEAVDAAMGIRPVERPQSISAWLKMFEAAPVSLPAPQPADDATRIGTPVAKTPTVAATPLPAPHPAPVPSPTAAPVIAPPVAAASLAPTQTGAAPSPIAQSAPAKRHWILWATTALVILAAVGVGSRLVLPLLRSAEPKSAAAPLVMAEKPVSRTVEESAAGLLADIQKFNRPAKEVAALTDANGKIAGLAAQLKGADPAKAKDLQSQMNDAGADMARNEATALGRAAVLLWRDIQPTPGKTAPAEAATSLATVTQAKDSLDKAVAAVAQAPDAAAALQAAREAVASYDAFSKAYDAVSQFFLTARRTDLATLDTQAQDVANKLDALGKVSKPWILASHARKQAYQDMVDAATSGTAQLAKIDAMNKAAQTATDLHKISTSLTQATAIKTMLDGLLTKSNAAYAIYNK